MQLNTLPSLIFALGNPSVPTAGSQLVEDHGSYESFGAMFAFRKPPMKGMAT